MRALLFCISGPSGVGKGTLVRELLKIEPELALSISCTTRAPRPGEREGVEYFFTTRETFERGIAAGEFIEYDDHFGNYYGTPKKYVFDEMAKGRSVILEIDVVGALIVKRDYGEKVINILIVPPSEEALDARLKGRGSESAEQIALRKKRVEYELSKAKEYDYVVVNDDLMRATYELRDIFRKEINL